MSKVRTAIVGLGMAVKPHAESYLELADRVEVAYAFSPSEARRRVFAQQYPFRLVDSFNQILEDDSVHFVSILTPPNTHLELVRRCAAAGKHVLLEKPLEINFNRAVALIDTCEQAGVKLGVVLQHRFRPSGERLRALLADRALGRIVGASVSVLNWRPQSYYDQPGRGDKDRDGGGVLITQGIHTLDLFLSLVGLPKELFAYAGTTAIHEMETEDLVSGCMQFDDGAIGTICATTAAYPGFPESISIIGEAGTADIVGTSLVVRYLDGGQEKLAPDGSGGGAGADPMDFPNDYHRALIADFVEAIERDQQPRITGREALKVHRFIACILKSANKNCPVTVGNVDQT